MLAGKRKAILARFIEQTGLSADDHPEYRWLMSKRFLRAEAIQIILASRRKSA
jgi:hypothetical protein